MARTEYEELSRPVQDVPKKEVPLAEEVRQLQTTMQDVLERVDTLERSVRDMKNRLWGE